MTTAAISKKNAIYLFILGVLATFILLNILGFIGRAWAEGVDPETPLIEDPTSFIMQAYDFMRSGRGTAAVGAFSMLVVWALRSPVLLGRIAFFQTKKGGYILGFFIPTLQYVAGALVATGIVSFSLFVNAIGAGFVASGGWVALRDFLNTKSPGAKSVVAATTTALLILMLVPGCPPSVQPVATATIDCAKENQDDILSIFNELTPALTGGTISWDDAYARAKHAGLNTGACIIGKITNWYLGSKKALADGDGWKVREMFEKYRNTELGNADILIDGKRL